MRAKEETIIKVFGVLTIAFASVVLILALLNHYTATHAGGHDLSTLTAPAIFPADGGGAVGSRDWSAFRRNN